MFITAQYTDMKTDGLEISKSTMNRP